MQAQKLIGKFKNHMTHEKKPKLTIKKNEEKMKNQRMNTDEKTSRKKEKKKHGEKHDTMKK